MAKTFRWLDAATFRSRLRESPVVNTIMARSYPRLELAKQVEDAIVEGVASLELSPGQEFYFRGPARQQLRDKTELLTMGVYEDGAGERRIGVFETRLPGTSRVNGSPVAS